MCIRIESKQSSSSSLRHLKIYICQLIRPGDSHNETKIRSHDKKGTFYAAANYSARFTAHTPWWSLIWYYGNSPEFFHDFMNIFQLFKFWYTLNWITHFIKLIPFTMRCALLTAHQKITWWNEKFGKNIEEPTILVSLISLNCALKEVN